MTDIVLLTRDPALGGNNWVLSVQEPNKAGTPWRYILWGKGRGALKGSSFAEVDTDLDQYVANRVGNNYVEQVRVKIFFPMEKIVRFVAKHLPKIIALAERVRIGPSTPSLPDLPPELQKKLDGILASKLGNLSGMGIGVGPLG